MHLIDSKMVVLLKSSKLMITVLLILLCNLTPLDCSYPCFATMASSSDPPSIWPITPLGPMPSSGTSPGYQRFIRKFPLPLLSFHRTANKDCGGIYCTIPLSLTSVGSPCGCVTPIRVVIDVHIDSCVLFNLVQELKIEVAYSTFLEQSQVKIRSAVASPRGQRRTEVTMFLVPTGQRFDDTIASQIYERFSKKEVKMNKTLFHDYDVVYVDYPGLPFFQQSSATSASGPSVDGSSPYPNAHTSDGNIQKVKLMIIHVVAISVLIFLCVGISIFVMKAMKIRQQAVGSGGATSSTRRTSGIRYTISDSGEPSPSLSLTSTTYPLSVRTFSLSELEKATDSFGSNRKLGEGGCGCVYHGTMEDGSEVAVKLLKKTAYNRNHEQFVSELEMLTRLHHRNLVKLIGVCIEGHKRCLVYELVQNGSLESHLHGANKGKGPLTWDARMKIALGSARALAYLHEDSNPSIIHRDFKASNVLLERDFTPKVSDFGLAKEAPDGTRSFSTRVMGTFGYVDPEYAMTGTVLIKSDVYSYGVVLLELLSGRKPVYMTDLHDAESLVVWARPLLGSIEGISQLVDPYLRENCDDFENIAQVAAIALACVHESPSRRPFMSEVVQGLKLVDVNREEICGSSPTQNEPAYSSFGLESGDFMVDFASEESNRWSAPLRDSSITMNVDYGFDSGDRLRRARSVCGFVGRPEPIGWCWSPFRSMRNQSSSSSMN